MESEWGDVLNLIVYLAAVDDCCGDQKHVCVKISDFEKY